LIGVSLPEAKFLDASREGNCSGDWIAESKYLFNIVPNIKSKNKSAFQIWGKLNLEFGNGGSMEYQCELIYVISNTEPGQPPLDILVDVASKCTKDFEALLDKANAVDRNDQTKNIWIPYDKEIIEEMVSKSLKKNFP